MDEIWKTIDEFDAYEVSSFGRVRRRYRTVTNSVAGHVLKPFLSASGKGYQTVTLCDGKRRRKRAVHVLVCTAFHGPRPSPEHQAAHWNGNKAENTEANLRWATRPENGQDMVRHGKSLLGQRHPLAKLSDDAVRTIAASTGTRGIGRTLAAQFGVSESLVSMIRSGRHRPHLSSQGATR